MLRVPSPSGSRPHLWSDDVFCLDCLPIVPLLLLMGWSYLTTGIQLDIGAAKVIPHKKQSRSIGFSAGNSKGMLSGASKVGKGKAKD